MGKVPSKANGGKLYSNSPEFRYVGSLTHNDTSIGEFLENQLSFLKFPQMEESFFIFQRRIIREILLRCYHGKDLEGFIQVIIFVFCLRRLTFLSLNSIPDFKLSR
jgi:hypothetical protein